MPNRVAKCVYLSVSTRATTSEEEEEEEEEAEPAPPLSPPVFSTAVFSAL